MRVIRLVKNFSKPFTLDMSQTVRNKMIALLMIIAIIMPIINNGSVLDYIALFSLTFLILNPQPKIVASPCH